MINDLIGKRDEWDPVVLTWSTETDLLHVDFLRGLPGNGDYVTFFIFDNLTDAFRCFKRFADMPSYDRVFWQLVNSDLYGQPLPDLADGREVSI